MLTKPSDPARDFCQWPYRRPKPIRGGSLRQESILWEAARQADSSGEFAGKLREIQSAAGRFTTVWGVKWSAGVLSFELYFYDYAREARRNGPAKMQAQLPEVFAFSNVIDESIPFFMWSTEASREDGYEFSSPEIYCSGTGGSISGGICYASAAGRLELKNLYYFFERSGDVDAIIERLEASPKIIRSNRLPGFALPGSAPGEIYVVSQKRFHDGIYLSRLTVKETISILRQCKFSEGVTRYLEQHHLALEHHLFDIGLDFEEDAQSGLKVTKSALFGIF